MTMERRAGKLRDKLSRSPAPYDMDVQQNKPELRELTRAELAAMKKLARDLCANYDYEYGCLLLDAECYMMYGVAYTCPALCKWFRNAVLPTDPVLEDILNGRTPPASAKCAACGDPFIPDGKQIYCSPACKDEGNRRRSRERMKKKRGTDKV